MMARLRRHIRKVKAGDIRLDSESLMMYSLVLSSLLEAQYSISAILSYSLILFLDFFFSETIEQVCQRLAWHLMIFLKLAHQRTR